MKKITIVVAAAVVGGLLIAAFAGAASSTVWKAKLNAKAEVPAQVVANAAGTGTFKGTVSGKTLKWKLTFAKLTGPATAAHIHVGAVGKAGNVLIPLCAPCKSPVSGSAKLTAAEITDFKKHKLYANVHTEKNPNGEIRGQLAK
jgi:CHRD domain